MECYEGATMIKTYRGILDDEGQEQIRLKTNDGAIGYRIVKFQIIPYEPSSTDQESIVKIYKLEQSTITSIIDFSDGDLLAVGYWTSNTNADANPDEMTVIFDQEIFNQDIWITHEERKDVAKCNYYLELEQVKLNENQSTMATLQSLRRLALPRN